MKVFVSKAYQKWAKKNKTERSKLAIENFLFCVFNATDIKNITPHPKPAGKGLRKIPGVVDEFVIQEKYRVYSKCLELKPGAVAFYLAMPGVKGDTEQNEDILKALYMFDDVTTTKWDTWKPSPEQIQAFCHPESQTVDTAPQMPRVATVPEKKTKVTQKGKPVDENGLTAAERKTLRKQAEQEARRKAQQEKAEKIKLQKEQEEAQQHQQAAEDEKSRVITTTDNNQPDVTFDTPGAQSHKAEADKPEITLNDTPVASPAMPAGDVTFQDVADIQYELELIDHQIKIEQLQMEIVRQNIAMAQHEIAMEQLKIKQLKLLQMQKQQNIQK